MRKVIISFLFILIFLKYPLIVFSNTCSINYYACSDKELCNYATDIKSGLIVWLSTDENKNYVELAQEKGLVCKVGSPIKVSEETLLTPNFLSTIKSNRKTEIDWKGLVCKNSKNKVYNIWFNDGEYSLIDTKNFGFNISKRNSYNFEGLSTLVLEDFFEPTINLILNRETLKFKNSSKKRNFSSINYNEELVEAGDPNCENDPTMCSDFMLCVFATNGYKRFWDTTKLSHIEEANSRGMNCYNGKDISLLNNLKEIEGICELRLDIKEILTPLIQEIKNELPKNKI